MRILSLFDGISTGNLLFPDSEYYSSEIDPKALRVSKNNFPHQIRLGDVEKIDYSELPKIDLLMAGSPCQSVSVAGPRTGFEGSSGLFSEYVRALEEVNPKKFFLENVKMKKEWRDQITEVLGVEPVLINSNVYGAQNRPRYYWFNWDFHPLKEVSDDRLGYHLNPVDGEARAYTERRTEEAKRIRREARKMFGVDYSPRRAKELVLRKDYKCNCLTATESNKEHLINTMGVDRMMTAGEWECMQGLPLDFTKLEGITESQRKKLIGNGWHVPTVAEIFKSVRIEND